MSPSGQALPRAMSKARLSLSRDRAFGEKLFHFVVLYRVSGTWVNGDALIGEYEKKRKEKRKKERKKKGKEEEKKRHCFRTTVFTVENQLIRIHLIFLVFIEYSRDVRTAINLAFPCFPLSCLIASAPSAMRSSEIFSDYGLH